MIIDVGAVHFTDAQSISSLVIQQMDNFQKSQSLAALCYLTLLLFV